MRLWYSVVDDTDALRIPEVTSPLASEVPEVGAKEREREREDPVELDSNVPPNIRLWWCGLAFGFSLSSASPSAALI